MDPAVKRQTQSLMLLILGGALLNISAFSNTYVNYVKPGFRPLLLGAGVVLVILALVSLVRQWRGQGGGQGDGHDHGDDHGPRVAWLLAVPVFTIVLIAPPALGSFAAGGEDDAPTPRPPAPAGFLKLSDGVPSWRSASSSGAPTTPPARRSRAGRSS